MLFTAHARSGFVQREQEVIDQVGRRRVVPVRTYMERKGFILQPKFIFIDGRTGTTLYSESYKEEVLYSPQQTTPALSSYFELMDRLVPSFLSTLSTPEDQGIAHPHEVGAGVAGSHRSDCRFPGLCALTRRPVRLSLWPVLDRHAVVHCN